MDLIDIDKVLDDLEATEEPQEKNLQTCMLLNSPSHSDEFPDVVRSAVVSDPGVPYGHARGMLNYVDMNLTGNSLTGMLIELSDTCNDDLKSSSALSSHRPSVDELLESSQLSDDIGPLDDILQPETANDIHSLALPESSVVQDFIVSNEAQQNVNASVSFNISTPLLKCVLNTTCKLEDSGLSQSLIAANSASSTCTDSTVSSVPQGTAEFKAFISNSDDVDDVPDLELEEYLLGADSHCSQDTGHFEYPDLSFSPGHENAEADALEQSLVLHATLGMGNPLSDSTPISCASSQHGFGDDDDDDDGTEYSTDSRESAYGTPDGSPTAVSCNFDKPAVVVQSTTSIEAHMVDVDDIESSHNAELDDKSSKMQIDNTILALKELSLSFSGSNDSQEYHCAETESEVVIIPNFSSKPVLTTSAVCDSEGNAGAVNNAFPDSFVMQPSETLVTSDADLDVGITLEAEDTVSQTSGDETTEETTVEASYEEIGNEHLENIAEPDRNINTFVDSNQHLVTTHEICGSPQRDEPYYLTESELQLGKIKPVWIPDADAPSCMLCGIKFTVVKRRHHCRACGRVLCRDCCNRKANLEFGKIGRDQKICEPCSVTLKRIENYNYEQELLAGSNLLDSAEGRQELSSTNSEQPSVDGAVQPVNGVLKKEDTSSTMPKSVIFSDGVRPGVGVDHGDTSDGAMINPGPRGSTLERAIMYGQQSSRAAGAKTTAKRSSKGAVVNHQEMECFLPTLSDESCGNVWPNVVIEGERHVADMGKICKQLEDEDAPPVEFAIKRNLTGCIKLIKLLCCVKKDVWCVTSQGLRCVGQDEIMVLLERTDPQDTAPPTHILHVFNSIYEEALQGTSVHTRYLSSC